MEFLREENKRLSTQNRMLNYALDHALEDAEKQKERFIQDCMNCKLRKQYECIQIERETV